jgi:hypothetical protein
MLVNAQARPSEVTYDLESIKGGWVTVRRFDHGERIDRLGKILVMGIGGEKDSKGGQGDGESSGEARINHRAARLHDFAKAIVDHNLADKSGKKYDFRKPESVFAIDAEIGDEIDDIIGTHQEAIPEEDVPKSDGNSPDST